MKTAFERLDEAFEKINTTGMSPVEKTAFERLDEAIEKVAERKEKLSKGQKVFMSGVGAGALGAPLLLSSTAGYNKAAGGASALKLQKNLTINNIAKKKKLARALKAAQIKQIAGASGMALGGAASYASLPIMLTGGAIMLGERNNMNKEAFETVDEAIEKVAERDNKRVAGNATGAMLLGAGGTGLYYANKDKAIASQANKAAKKSFNSAVASSAATLPLAGISLKNTLSNVKGTKELAAAQAQAKNNPGLSSYRDLQKAEDKAKELVKASNKYKKTRSLASNALLANSFVEGSNFKKQTSIAEKALKNSKLKGAAGIAGLGLGAGTLLAANKKKD